MTTLNNLPDEIIVVILDNFSIRDRFNVRRLNRRWRRLCWIGITELLLDHGDDDDKDPRPDDEFWKMISRPKHRINFKQDQIVWRLLLKECGHCLSTLVVRSFVGWTDSKPTHCSTKWSSQISLISFHCPNIVRLYVECFQRDPSESCLSLFQHYGHHRLEGVRLICGHHHTTKLDPHDFVIAHSNCEYLQILSLNRIDQIRLQVIANNFPLLAKLEIWQCSWETCQENRSLNFDCLHKLTHLKEFRCDKRLSDDGFRSLMTSLSIANLQKLALNGHMNSVVSSSFKLLRNFISMRSLTISVHPHFFPNPSEIIFIPCLKGLRSLKQLTDMNLRLSVRETDDPNWKECLQLLSQLKSLIKLQLDFFFVGHVDFAFNFFSVMPSIIDLTFSIDYVRCSSKIYKNHTDIENLWQIFPNLIHLSILWSRGNFVDLLSSLIRLTRLKTLHFWANADKRWQLQTFCNERNIDLHFNAN